MVSIFLVAPLFHAQVTGTLLLFIKLSREWPKFLNKISSIDECFVKRYKSSTNLRRKIYVLAVSAYALVNVLHLLAMVKFQIMKDCHNSFTGFKYYIKKHFHYVFDLIPYNTITGVILLASSFVGLYIWTYGDIFIASTSMILTTRFHEIRERIYIYTRAMSTRERRLLKVLPKDIQKLDLLFWKEIRRDYNMMSKLCRKLNSLISNVILLDYASNLILILFQLFTGLGRKYTFPEMMYFYFSFGYMTLRISLLSAFGGWLYEAGRASIHILNMVPTEIYNNEISKLIHQMHNCTPCFTGKGFFRITKGLTLNIAAAIITYELVLVQFNQTKGNSDHVNQSACK
ncbi:hypothetical protein NQ315_010633 [Exocentrus adspersus]|uniref:Gustatory receptor n=1 Tax=Exocentrus adspersus TaxID=1586481 RepID=A0AAV8W5K2_9CUCU|nr:hypothetical protein NQ315_010633 [Exocentrus adspersus]